MKSIQGKVSNCYKIAFDCYKAVNGFDSGEAIEKLLVYYMARNPSFEALCSQKVDDSLNRGVVPQ